MVEKKYVETFYQGIYLTETILGNPNGDFNDNAPRNFDGRVFTTDKCIKYNVRKYMQNTIENLDKKENIIFAFPRLCEGSSNEDNKFKNRDDVFNFLLENVEGIDELNNQETFEKQFEFLKENSPDVRMFGGTFSFQSDDKSSKQIYGPIQLTYGIDINDADFKRLQIGAPFATESGKQKTNGSEYVVDDAIISYDVTINPNNHPKLLLDSDLNLFKKSLWYGTNLRKSTSKRTDSKLLILIKFKKSKDNTIIHMGELKELVSVNNIKKHKLGNEKIILNVTKLIKRLIDYLNYIDCIELFYDEEDIQLTIITDNIDENLKKIDKWNNEFTKDSLSNIFRFNKPSDLLE